MSLQDPFKDAFEGLGGFIFQEGDNNNNIEDVVQKLAVTDRQGRVLCQGRR
jgi:hypothetical protein